MCACVCVCTHARTHKRVYLYSFGPHPRSSALFDWPGLLHSSSCPGGSVTASTKQFENQCPHWSSVGLILLLITPLCLFLLALASFSLYICKHLANTWHKACSQYIYNSFLHPFSFVFSKLVNKIGRGQSCRICGGCSAGVGRELLTFPCVVSREWGLERGRKPDTLLVWFWAVSISWLFLLLWYSKVYFKPFSFYFSCGVWPGVKSPDQISTLFGWLTVLTNLNSMYPGKLKVLEGLVIGLFLLIFKCDSYLENPGDRSLLCALPHF